MRVGLLGGSFNPAHAGHLHIARVALKRLRLDQVWLLVSPGNPLKTLLAWPPLHSALPLPARWPQQHRAASSPPTSSGTFVRASRWIRCVR